MATGAFLRAKKAHKKMKAEQHKAKQEKKERILGLLKEGKYVPGWTLSKNGLLEKVKTDG